MFTGPLLPPGHRITTRLASFEVLRTLNHDPAASEIVVATNLQVHGGGNTVVIKAEQLSSLIPQAYNDEAVLHWLTHARGQGQLAPRWKPPKSGLPRQVTRLIMHTRNVPELVSHPPRVVSAPPPLLLHAIAGAEPVTLLCRTVD